MSISSRTDLMSDGRADMEADSRAELALAGEADGLGVDSRADRPPIGTRGGLPNEARTDGLTEGRTDRLTEGRADVPVLGRADLPSDGRADNLLGEPSLLAGEPSLLASKIISTEERRARVFAVAYRNAELRGFMPGGELDDWLAAEREVAAENSNSI
jgi:hypothetical protein